MWTSNAGTTLYINLDRDSVLGNTASSYQTFIVLLDGKLQILGGTCSAAAIPGTYTIMNLPIKTPKVLLSTNTGSFTVSKC